jgi:hypothetical protein
VCDWLTLKGGTIVSVPALRLAWTLEAKGCTLTLDGDVLRVRPARVLDATDRELIQRLAPELKHIARYCDEIARALYDQVVERHDAAALTAAVRSR